MCDTDGSRLIAPLPGLEDCVSLPWAWSTCQRKEKRVRRAPRPQHLSYKTNSYRPALSPDRCLHKVYQYTRSSCRVGNKPKRHNCPCRTYTIHHPWPTSPGLCLSTSIVSPRRARRGPNPRFPEDLAATKRRRWSRCVDLRAHDRGVCICFTRALDDYD